MTHSKPCRRCETEKPLGDFYRHPQSADGFFGTCKVCTRAASSARTRAPEGRAAHAKWRASSSEKIAAHSAVAVALKSGALSRKPCERCGADGAQAHHDDYSKPLEVLWLCPEHHGERHRQLRLRAAAHAQLTGDAS